MNLYKQYASGTDPTLPALRAFSSWLLFAKSAASCADALTRSCLYTAARKESAWTAGGLQAPVDLTAQDNPLKCFNVEQATGQGWAPAELQAEHRGLPLRRSDRTSTPARTPSRSRWPMSARA